MKITVYEPRWPKRCVCCDETSETTIQIEFVEADEEKDALYKREWAVPYCSRCREHVQSSLSLTTKTFLGPMPSLGALFSLIASLILCVSFESLWPFIGVTALIFGLIFIYRSKGIQKAQLMMKPSCSWHGPAVVCLAHDENGGHRHTFNFKNREYAEIFKDLNEAA